MKDLGNAIIIEEAIDKSLADMIRKRLGKAGSMSIGPLLIHFQHNQPKTPKQEQNVLTNPTELKMVSSAIQSIGGEYPKGIRLKVYGYADSTGDIDHNRILARNRANWVIQKIGLKNTIPVGCGDYYARKKDKDDGITPGSVQRPAYRVVLIQIFINNRPEIVPSSRT
jgi:hypothetical protein